MESKCSIINEGLLAYDTWHDLAGKYCQPCKQTFPYLQVIILNLPFFNLQVNILKLQFPNLQVNV